MLRQNHGGAKLGNQPLDLHAGKHVDVVEGLVPQIQVGLLAQAPGEERFLPSPELLLAGHYCGGVWRVPLLGAFFVPDKTMARGGWFPKQSSVAGASTIDEIQVFITRGLSTNGSVPLLPFRLFNPPEIALLTLTSTLPENMLEAGQ